MTTYATIEVPTERTELDEELVMYLVKAAMNAEGREKHLADIAVMRELARQFPAANIVEVNAKWEKRILKAQAEADKLKDVDPEFLHCMTMPRCPICERGGVVDDDDYWYCTKGHKWPKCILYPDDSGEYLVDDAGRPQCYEPQSCHNCRSGTLHTLNGSIRTQGPTERYFTCKLNHETCDPEQNPDEFQCSAWQAQRSAQQDRDELFPPDLLSSC